MPLRAVKMYGRILGFQRLVWCPKWTPASSSCFRVTWATFVTSLLDPPPGARLAFREDRGQLRTCVLGLLDRRSNSTQAGGPSHARRAHLGRLPTGRRGTLRALAPGVVAAGLEGPVAALALDHRLPADRARLVQHLGLGTSLDPAVLALGGAVFAVGIPVAGDEGPETAPALDQLALTALRALVPGRGRLGTVLVSPHVLAARIPRAADEFSVATAADLQRLAALWAGVLQQLRLGRLAGRQHRLPVPTLWVPRAALEGAEAAGLQDQLSFVALGTLFASLRRHRLGGRGEPQLARVG